MSKPARPTLIGGFVLGAIVLIIAGVIILGGGKFFARRTPIVMFFQGSVSGLSVGAAVNFRGVRVGQVSQVFIRYHPDGNDVLVIPVFADLSTDNIQLVGTSQEKKAVRRGTDDTLRELVERGLRAQLALPSLVTGQATVSLDFFPATPADFASTYPERVEIPTVPSTLQEVQATIEQVIDKVSQLPLDELVNDTRNLVKGANKLVNDPAIIQALTDAAHAMADLQQTARMIDSRLGPLLANIEATSTTANRTLQSAQEAIATADVRSRETFRNADALLQTAQKALAQADTTLKSANAVIQPGGTINYEVVAALRETAGAARALKDLADQLQRSPNSLLFGRPSNTGGRQ